MSITRVGAVLKHYGGKPHLKLTAVVLANHADEVTGRCFPSYRTIAAQCNCSRSTAIRNVETLIAQGVLRIVRHGGIYQDPEGDLVPRSNEYEVCLDALIAMPDSKKRQRQRSSSRAPEHEGACNRGGITGGTRAVAPVAPGDGSAGATLTVLDSEPSVESTSRASLSVSGISEVHDPAVAPRTNAAPLAVKIAQVPDESEITAACQMLSAVWGVPRVAEALKSARAYAKLRGEPLTAGLIEFMVDAVAV